MRVDSFKLFSPSFFFFFENFTFLPCIGSISHISKIVVRLQHMSWSEKACQCQETNQSDALGANQCTPSTSQQNLVLSTTSPTDFLHLINPSSWYLVLENLVLRWSQKLLPWSLQKPNNLPWKWNLFSAELLHGFQNFFLQQVQPSSHTYSVTPRYRNVSSNHPKNPTQQWSKPLAQWWETMCKLTAETFPLQLTSFLQHIRLHVSNIHASFHLWNMVSFGKSFDFVLVYETTQPMHLSFDLFNYTDMKNPSKHSSKTHTNHLHYTSARLCTSSPLASSLENYK